jgi:hypothetical protein
LGVCPPLLRYTELKGLDEQFNISLAGVMMRI